MLKLVLRFIARFSSSVLLGAAHGANLRGELFKSYSFSIDGLKRSKLKNNSMYWSEFLSLAIDTGVKLKNERYFREISSIVLSDGCPVFYNNTSESLLKLAKWGFGLKTSDAPKELIDDIVEKAINADEKNANAWFIAGWISLDSNVDNAVSKLRKSVSLDTRMISRIQKDEKCKIFLNEELIELLSV